MKILGRISAGLLLLVSAGAVNAQWAQMPTAGLTGNNVSNQPSILKVVDGAAEKTVLMNSDGIFEYNPSTQSWSRYGSGLEGISISSIAFGSLGKFAVSSIFRDPLDVVQGGILYKFDDLSEKWDTVKADVPDSPKDLGIAGVINGRVFQYTQKGKNRLFLTSFGNDTTFGIVYSDDMGTTWKNYNNLTTEIGDSGLFREAGRIVTSQIAADSEGRLYISTKNLIQISLDGGDTWVNRIGNYVLNTGNSNIRTIVVRNYQGVEYLVIGTDDTNGSRWHNGYTVSNDTAATTWVGGQSIFADPVCFSDYAGKYLFTVHRDGGFNPHLTTNNTETWAPFGENLPLISNQKDNPNRTRGLSIAGDSMYLTFPSTHPTAPNAIYVFNLLDLDAPKVQFQISDAADGDPIQGAVVEFNGRTLSTNLQGMVTVYGIKDSTDVPLKITKSPYESIDSTITFTTINPLTIQMRIVTSLDSYKPSESTLHPNPASDMVYLPVGAQNVTVMSASGAPMSVPVVGRSLNVSGLNPGLYIVRTSSGTYKFMKK